MSQEYFICREHVVPGQHIRHYAKGTSQSQEDELFLAVKQYIPQYDRPAQAGDVTIIACHGSGFPKELYEPIWDQLFRRSQNSASCRIRNIWITDVANQNVSGVLNEGRLGSEPSYFDHARDLLCVINHFRTEMCRPLVGFGHSMGGTVMINLALLHPRLLTTLVTIEPILNKTPLEMNFRPVFGLTFKRDLWPDRQEAERMVRKNPLYKMWDSRILALYLTYGLRDTPNLIHDAPNQVTLVTTKHQEAFSYARAASPSHGQSHPSFSAARALQNDLDIRNQPADSAFYLPVATQTFAQLPFLAPSCLFISGSKTHMFGSSKQGRQNRLAVTGTGVGGSGGYRQGRVADHVIQGGSHFVPFEKPTETANVTFDHFQSELDRWHQEELAELQSQSHLSPRQKAMVNDNWTWWVREQFGPQKAGREAKL